jgi:hypothetical protein
MNILLLGDSHTDIFHGRQYVNRFEMSQCQSPIFTVHRFCNSNDELWNKLDTWFKINTNQPSSLIITGGEIDIRAHFWRQIPRSYVTRQDIEIYISNTAYKFLDALQMIIEKYQLEKIVIWGAPVAGEKADYNFEVPFVGSSQTRNILVHLWNKTLLQAIDHDPRISLATAYYNFINPENYFTTQTNTSHDGVHWHHSFGNLFWEKFIDPALQGSSIVGHNFNRMASDQFDILETDSTGNQQYDTWVQTDQLKNSNIDLRQVIIKDVSYSWLTANHRTLLPEQYKEIELKKI